MSEDRPNQKRIEFSDMGPEKLADEIAAELGLGGNDAAPPESAAPPSRSAEEPAAETAEKAGQPAAAGEGPAGTPRGAGETGALLRSEETVGEMLLAARERSGQTIEYMSTETKIPKQMLQYLETDNFEALPAKVYVKSFLRTYADALDLDPQHVLGKYELQTGQTHRTKGDHWEIESEVVEEKLRSPLLVRRLVIGAIIVIAIVVVIVKLATRREEPAEKDAARAISGDLRQELLERREPATAVPPPVVETPAAAETREPPGPMELVVSANPTDTCWIELETISIVDQQTERTDYTFSLQPGRTRTFQATEEFRFLKIGNAGGIVLSLDGTKLPTLGKKGKVITNYSVTRENLPKGERAE